MALFDDLFSYPNTTGHKGGGASRDAAEAMDVSGKAGSVRDRVIAYLKAGHTATADDIALALGEIPGNVRPRLSGLLHSGLVEKLTECGSSCNGVPQHKWRST